MNEERGYSSSSGKFAVLVTENALVVRSVINRNDLEVLKSFPHKFLEQTTCYPPSPRVDKVMCKSYISGTCTSFITYHRPPASIAKNIYTEIHLDSCINRQVKVQSVSKTSRNLTPFPTQCLIYPWSRHGWSTRKSPLTLPNPPQGKSPQLFNALANHWITRSQCLWRYGHQL